MALLKRIWEDIRHGENIDLFVTVFLAIGLVVLNVLGLAPQAWIAPLTLAILGLLAIATLGNRYQVEKAVKELSRPSHELFLEKVPASQESDLERARVVWMIGVTLSRTIKTQYSLLEHKLARGDSVRILLVDPAGEGVEMAVMREYGGRFDTERGRQLIRDSLSDLCVLKKAMPDKLEIRTINHPLGFGGIAIDPDTSKGVLYLEHFSYKMPGGSLPKLVLSAPDGRWYQFFKTEMQTLWENGTTWECKS